MIGALCTLSAGGQLEAQDSSATVALPFANFREMVRANHPIAQQARLVGDQARSAVQEAWGAFDPKFSLGSSQKALKGTPYYNYLDASIKVPTPIGSDIKLGFERASGTRLNPDRATAATGLFSLGLTIPLGQRIITDERRTALRQARALRDAGEAEQQGIVNKLLLDAAKVYGGWYSARRRYEIAIEGVRLATFRLNAVRVRVLNGDSAPIDTIEAVLEVQRRAVTELEAQTELRAAQLLASTYVWNPQGQPVEIDPNTRPVLDGLEVSVADTVKLSQWLDFARSRHPDLRKAEGKLKAAEAERLLALQGLLPNAEGSLASLSGRDDTGGLVATDKWRDNYKAGLDIQTSLLLRKERGKLSRSSQKAEFAMWDRDDIRRDLLYGVRVALNDLVLLERLLVVQRTNVTLSSRLRDAEQVRFENGESTLLLVNIRERALFDESTKLVSLEGKLASTRAALVVAVGDPTALGALP